MSREVNVSVGRNMVYNMIKQGCSLVFPMVTFAYASHILGAENIGKISFSQSVISYVFLIASFGISGYAVREGVYHRNERECFEKFASEIYSINAIATLAAYVLLWVMIFCSGFLQNYVNLLAVQSLSMVMTFLGADWINSIYEDYRYLTIRYILVQLISLLCLFLFVKSANDLMLYNMIYTFANAGGVLFNVFYVRRYARPQLVINKAMLDHLKPLFLIFGTSLSVIIYVNSDITILTFFLGDKMAGIYSAATKVYQAIKHLMFATITVMIPRISYMIAHHKEQAKTELLNRVINQLLLVLLPVVVGLWFEGHDILYLFSGREYVEGAGAVRILCIAILCAVVSNIFNNGILLPYKQEKAIFLFSIAACGVNVGLNFIFIPLWGMEGAAFTTLAAETVNSIGAFLYSKKYVRIFLDYKVLLSEIVGCIAIGTVCLVSAKIVDDVFERLFWSVALSIGCYLLLQTILRNKIILEIYAKIKGDKNENTVRHLFK